MTRALVLGRLEVEGASVGLVRVGAGTSYSPSRASIIPCNRPSCCLKSCSTLQRRERKREQLKGNKGAPFGGWGNVNSSKIYLYRLFFTKKRLDVEAERDRERGDEQRDVRTNGGLLSRKRD